MYELFRKLIKEEMEFNEKINQMTKGDILEVAFKQLSVIDSGSINTQIEKYREEKEVLLKEYDDVTKKLSDLVNKYYDELIKSL